MKIGDRVRVVRGVYMDHPSIIGKTCMIVCEGEPSDWHITPIMGGENFAVYEKELELVEEPMKKLDMKKVKAVGGCQHDALVALLKDMGYEIEEPKKPGVLVKPGMKVKLYGREFTVAPKGAYEDKYVRVPDNTIELYEDDGSVTWHRAGHREDSLMRGDQVVIGYE